MSTAALTELTTPTEPVRGRIDRAIHSARRHARTVGLTLWAAAGTVFALHASGTAFPDSTRFAMLDSWLIGLGCLGCPLMALRDLERRINLQVFGAVTVFCVALATLLTALILGGALRGDTVDDIFALILPLAPAIQALNATDGEVHARRREAAAHQAGREDAVAAQVDQARAALAGLSHLEEMSVGDLYMLAEVVSGLIEKKRCDQPLRLVTDDGGLPRQINSAARTARS